MFQDLCFAVIEVMQHQPASAHNGIRYAALNVLTALLIVLLSSVEHSVSSFHSTILAENCSLYFCRFKVLSKSNYFALLMAIWMIYFEDSLDILNCIIKILIP